MQLHEVLEKFPLPAAAVDDLSRHPAAHMRNLQHGVDVMMGHESGLPFVIEVHAELNQRETQLAKQNRYRNVEVFKWLKSKLMKPVARVIDIIDIDKETGLAVSGDHRYVEAYNRWKTNTKTPGTSLHKWDVLDEASLATLVDSGVFTVEQFAEMPRQRVESKFPPNIVEFYDQAIFFLNAKKGHADVDGILAKTKELELAAAKKDSVIEQLEARLAALESGKPLKKSRKKVSEDEINEAA